MVCQTKYKYRKRESVMVNFICQLDWCKGWLGKHFFYVPMRMFPEEISIWINRLSIKDCPLGGLHPIYWEPERCQKEKQICSLLGLEHSSSPALGHCRMFSRILGFYLLVPELTQCPQLNCDNPKRSPNIAKTLETKIASSGEPPFSGMVNFLKESWSFYFCCLWHS